jgi:hypothetical protein
MAEGQRGIESGTFLTTEGLGRLSGNSGGCARPRHAGATIFDKFGRRRGKLDWREAGIAGKIVLRFAARVSGIVDASGSEQGPHPS